MKQNVALGFLGTTLDGVRGEERWSRWRPTVALCQQEDLVVHRLELFRETRFAGLADQVVRDIAQGLTRDRGAGARDEHPRPVGFRAGLCGAA
jgi:sigma54-dependent transcription regulator